MSQSGAIHAGYLHQDVLAACALARLHFAGNTDVLVTNDVKSHGGDKFDDLTITGESSRHHQIKWHEDAGRLLTVSDLRTTKIGFRIDEVLRSFLSDATVASEYRLLTTCAGPDTGLSSYLVEDPSTSPSSPGLPTRRFRISSTEVWPEGDSPQWDVLACFDRQDFAEFCEVFVIETDCPRCSLDLNAPGELELHLLALLENGLGVGRFPNTSLTPVRAAAQLIHLAIAARVDKRPRSREDVREALGLQIDFGRVPEHLPVDEARLVPIPDSIGRLAELTTRSQIVVVQGTPGSGKSWLLEGLRKHLVALGELAVAHYCFVGLGDQDQLRRSTADVVFGSLIGELHDLDGSLVAATVPRYAAGPRELERILAEAVSKRPDRPITLIVDGLDHADRLPRAGARLALELAQGLTELDLPDGVRLVIGSQAGEHLKPLRAFAAITEVGPWTDDQVRALAVQSGVEETEVLDVIVEKAQGNPLYATYLSRTVLGVVSGETELRSTISVAEHLLSAPAFDEGLSSYYRWLFDAATADKGAEVVITALALIGLPLTAAELREIFALFSTIIPHVLSLLSPVLLGDVLADEIRIYHESFQRFVAERTDHAPLREDVFTRVIAWLWARGFFEDLRAFRWLMPMLSDSGRHAEVIGLCNPDFVSNAIAWGQPGDTVMANLAIAAHSARELGALPDLVRVVELNRAADNAYNWVLNNDDLAPLYAHAFVAVHGASALSQRLLHDGRRSFHPRVGIMLCHLCDRAGEIPAWEPHLAALERLRASNDIIYASGEPNVDAARVFGELRLANAAEASLLVHSWLSEDATSGVHPHSMAWAYARLFGIDALLDVIEQLVPGPNRGWARLAAARACDDHVVAERLAFEAIAEDLDEPPAIRVALQVGSVPAKHHVRQGVDQLTLEINSELGHLRTEESLIDWIAELDIAAALGDTAGLRRVEGLIQGPGWYRRWLRFAVRLRLRPRPDDVLAELRALSENVEPTVTQLYFAYTEIERSFHDAMSVMNDEHFPAAAKALFTLSRTVTPDPAVRFGPLVVDDVLKILLSTSDTPAKRTAASELSAARLAPTNQVGDVYHAHATDQLLLTRLHARAHRAELAQEAWHQACAYLCAYGHRKDLTVFEIGDALPALGAVDPARVTTCIAATLLLAEAVIAHTDLKGTRRALSSLAEDAVALHPAGGLLHLAMRVFANRDSSVNLDSAMATGIAALRGVMSDEVLHACGVAITKVDAEDAGDLAEQSATRTGDEGAELKAFKRRVARRSDSRPQLAEGTQLASPFVIEHTASPAQIAHAVRRWRAARQTAGVESVVASVVSKIVEIDERDEAEARWLLHRIGTDSFIMSHDQFLSGLADGLELEGKPRLAAIALVLVYTRTIDGSRRFTGSKSGFLRAVALDESDAWATLIHEIADSVRPGVEFGSTVHLLEVLAAGGRTDEAYACWEEARKVIAHRLPIIGSTDTTVVPYDPAADDVLAGMAAFLVARLQNRADREAVFECVRILVGLVADEAVQLAAHMIAFAKRYLSPLLVDELLDVVKEYEPAPFEVTRKAADTLTAIAASDIYSLSDSAQRLLGRAEA